MEARIQSDGSDFQFNSWEFSSDDPPVSPKLHSVSHMWESSDSSHLIKPTSASSIRLLAAVSIDHSIDASLGQNRAASDMVYHNHDDANAQRVLVGDGSGRVEAFGRRSFDEINSARPKPTSALTQFALKPENDSIRSTASEEMGLFNNSKHDSPAASPSRRTATDYERVAHIKIHKSPHAHHYEQQRIRAQQLSRKTFLPYRHNILSFCFLSSSRPVASY